MTSSDNELTFNAPPLSDREYAECFDTFKRISTEWQSTQSWLIDDFLPQREWTDPLKILSIGSGTGDFDLQLMRFVLRRWRVESYVAVDPNPDHNQIFETRFRESGLPVQDFRIHSQAFPVQGLDMQFDLVHMSHCLYYIPDRLKAIKSALDILNEQGRILIFHQTPLGINEIQRRFLKRAKGSTSEMYSSQDIYKLLESLSASFAFDIIDGVLDVSDFASPESPKGRQLLNFFLECRADLLPPEFREEVVDFVKSLAFPENNHQVIFHPVGVFSVSRTYNR
ncbi:MAG: class I SAM-dependent methyltransferase [Pseudomonadota bacterium]